MQLIGKITGVHGLKGEVRLHHQLQKTNFSHWDCVLIEVNPESYIPFFIRSIQSAGTNDAILAFEEIQHREDAKQIIHKNVYSSPNYTIVQKEETGFSQFIGFTIWDEGTAIGLVLEVIENTMNTMFVVLYLNKEILIPVQDDLITSIHLEEKKIIMNLPEGLLEM